ncbi:MAG: type II secretion system protein [Candidatus Desulfatibia sp.]|uniref:type II secretion system protein n=1 Tax=Candidatus Desulfatibia sp. TaxID=3101189 RepID=UPI002F323E8F
MRLNSKCQSGFTLIEMLIVIVVLGILAMIIIPQITVSTEDAKISTLQTNLSGLRSSIETYYAQHDSIYPGAKKETDGTNTASDGEAGTAFLAQLTLYSRATGVTANVKDATFKFGPYIKGGVLPKNPFTATSNVTADFDETNITVRVADTASAWKFYPITGVFIANDTAAHALY